MDSSVLETFPVFADASPDRLDRIAAHCRVRECGPGDELFTRGTEADCIYGVLEGEVELLLVLTEEIVNASIDYEEALTVNHEVVERPIVVETLQAGEVFGWSSMAVPPGLWTTTARCAQPARVFSLLAADLKALFEADPVLGYRFMGRLSGIISQRLQKRTEKLIDAWGEAFDGGEI